MTKHVLKELRLLFIGTLVALIGFKYFVFPLALNQSGVGGIALIFAKYNQETIYSAINLNIYNLVYVGLNLPLILVAWYKIGKKFVVYSIITIILVPIILTSLPDGQLLNVLENKLLATLIGAVIVGVGTSQIYRAGGCPGGADFLSMYWSKNKPKIPIGKINLVLAVSILFTSQWILTNKFSLPFFNDTFFYTFVFFVVAQFTIDRLFPKHKIMKITVITTHSTAIIDIIKENFKHKSYSIYEVAGSRTSKQKHIDILLSYYESREFLDLIRNQEIKCFAYSTRLNNVHGTFVSKK